MKWHWYYTLAISGIIVIGALGYSLFGGETAIISGHVIATRLQGSNWICSGPWLWMVKADKAFYQGLFSACAKCDIPIGSQVNIGIATTIWTNEPLRANATGLYKAQGIGYVSWDGCQD